MWQTGRRVRWTELVRLRFSDMNLRMNFVTLKDNDGESRIVPIGSYAHAAMKKYMDEAYEEIKAAAAKREAEAKAKEEAEKEDAE